MSITELKAARKADAKSYDTGLRQGCHPTGTCNGYGKGISLRGSQELLTGIPGLGKSQVQIHYVACVSAGLVWPNGAKAVAARACHHADSGRHTGRCGGAEAVGGGREPWSTCTSSRCIRKEGENRQFLLSEDLDMLERAINAIGQVGLITIDPITAYMGGKIDSHKTTDVRNQLGPLKDFAEKMNIAVSTITHPAKNAGKRALDHYIGSQAFIAAGRIGHVCVAEVDEKR